MYAIKLIIAFAALWASTGNCEKQGMLESVEGINGVPNSINNFVAKTTDRILNKYKISRNLQSNPFQLFQACNDELGAELPITLEELKNFFQCVKDTVTAIVDQCLANFPGIDAAAKCFLSLGASGEIIDEVVDDLEDSEGDVPTGADSDSDDDSDEDYNIAFGSAAPLGDQCAIFGTAENPGAAACWILLDKEEIIAFANAAANNFAGIAGCEDLTELLLIIDEEIEIDDIEDFLEGDFDKYEENFDSCEESEEIRAELERAFNGAPLAASAAFLPITIFIAAFLNL